MGNSFFSLIYKNKEASELVSFSSVNNTVKQLDAAWLLCSHKNNWLNYITDDIQTIQYREEAFSDIMRCPELAELCHQCYRKAVSN